MQWPEQTQIEAMARLWISDYSSLAKAKVDARKLLRYPEDFDTTFTSRLDRAILLAVFDLKD